MKRLDLELVIQVVQLFNELLLLLNHLWPLWPPLF
jgi:hypothetical protein